MVFGLGGNLVDTSHVTFSIPMGIMSANKCKTLTLEQGIPKITALVPVIFL